MASADPPSADVIYFARLWEDAAGFAHAYPRTTGDAYRLQWRAIREVIRRDGNLKGVTT
jgi:hypothetical protein